MPHNYTSPRPRSTGQEGLALWNWIARRFPHWFNRPEHDAMMWRMFQRLLTAEARDE